MSEHPFRSLPPGDRTAAARAVYRFGEAVVRFRRSAEWAVADPGDGPDAGPGVPAFVDESLGELVEHGTLMADCFSAVTGLAAHVAAVRVAAETVRARLDRYWCGKAHRALLDRRRDGLEASDGAGEAYWNWRSISRSEFSPAAWESYQLATDTVAAALPPPHGQLLQLARLLAAVYYPLLSDYCHDTQALRAIDPVRLQGEISPQITRHLRDIRGRIPVLDTLPDRLEGPDVYRAATRLHKAALERLGAVEAAPAGRGGSPRGREPGAAVTASGPTPANPETSVAGLIKLKSTMDPGNKYVGLSLPVLRVFEAIHDLNRQPEEPVVILGPSGVGKTELAELIHQTSGRTGGFVGLHANEVSGGDENLQRTRWTGYGKKAAISGVSARESTTGFLQQAAGGTIFLDELHNLDRWTQQYLRKVLDRKPIQLAAGEGDPINPDVRLIFATYRDVEELKEAGHLEPDFVRRLNGRYLVVPSLDERREDIPLFVEKFRDGRQPGECFLLALMTETWEDGQVDRLIRTVKRVAARKPQDGLMTAADLVGLISEDAAGAVTGMTSNEIRRTLYRRLIAILEQQGFARGGHGGTAIQERLAELLSVNPSTISRRLRGLGLGADR